MVKTSPQIDRGEISSLLDSALAGEKYPIARLISYIENPLYSHQYRQLIFPLLQEKQQDVAKNLTIGITGTPGAGKSSLIGELCHTFIKDSEQKLAIVAIDPSSNVSGGSILGDRTRVVLPTRENRIFFRSQASQLEMGGVNPYTYHVIRFLRYLFDYVIIETVGIGQNETEVTYLADFSFLVLQPLGGDQIQFMKSGIMEVPNAFIINKCDEEELAAQSYHTLSTSLSFLKDTISQELPPIFLTSTVSKKGIQELFQFLQKLPAPHFRNQESKHQLQKWIVSDYGKLGLQKVLRDFPGEFVEEMIDFESLQAKIQEHMGL
ncbi:MAG: protein kinase [Spirochaetota bacterium]